MAMSTLDVQHAAIGAKRPIALLRCSQSLLVTGFLQYLPKDTKELPQWEGPWFSSLHCCGCVVTVDVFAGQNCRIVLVQVPALAHISDDNLGKPHQFRCKSILRALADQSSYGKPEGCRIGKSSFH